MKPFTLHKNICRMAGVVLAVMAVQVAANSNVDCEKARSVSESGLEAKDLAKKVELYSTAATLCPREPAYHYSLGVVLEKSNRIRDSIDSYKRALDADPSYPEAHFNLATLYKSVREYELAVSHYERFLDFTVAQDDYEQHRRLASQRLDEIKRGTAEYRAAMRQYDKDVQEYLASLPVETVEPESKQRRGVKELEFLVMTTGALCDYYGTTKNDRTYETLGKSLKLLNCLLVQEEDSDGAGRSDARLRATLELLAVVLCENPRVQGLVTSSIPRYETRRTLAEIERDLEQYASQSQPLPEAAVPAANRSPGVSKDISGVYELECPEVPTVRTGVHRQGPFTATCSPVTVTQRGTRVTMKYSYTSDFPGDSQTTPVGVMKMSPWKSATTWELAGTLVKGVIDCDGTMTHETEAMTMTISSGDGRTTETVPAGREVESYKTRVTVLANGDLEINGESGTRCIFRRRQTN